MKLLLYTKAFKFLNFLKYYFLLIVGKYTKVQRKMNCFCNVAIGGFSGACAGQAPPKGPDSFVLTYKICKM